MNHCFADERPSRQEIFTLTDACGWDCSVLMSTNLADWDYLGPATPLYPFFDTNAPAEPQRYYRLRWP